MAKNSAVSYRVLDPKPLLLGASGDSLQNVIVDPYPNGALVFVEDQASIYRLAKNSLAAVSAPDIIATARGAGSPGRWIKYAAGGGGGGVTLYTDAGAIVPGNVWTRVDPLITLEAADITFFTCSVRLASNDFEGVGRFEVRFEFSEDQMIWTAFDTYEISPIYDKTGSADDDLVYWLGLARTVQFPFTGSLIAHDAGFVRVAFFGDGTNINMDKLSVQVAQQ